MAFCSYRWRTWVWRVSEVAAAAQAVLVIGQDFRRRVAEEQRTRATGTERQDESSRGGQGQFWTLSGGCRGRLQCGSLKALVGAV